MTALPQQKGPCRFQVCHQPPPGGPEPARCVSRLICGTCNCDPVDELISFSVVSASGSCGCRQGLRVHRLFGCSMHAQGAHYTITVSFGYRCSTRRVDESILHPKPENPAPPKPRTQNTKGEAFIPVEDFNPASCRRTRAQKTIKLHLAESSP